MGWLGPECNQRIWDVDTEMDFSGQGLSQPPHAKLPFPPLNVINFPVYIFLFKFE